MASPSFLQRLRWLLSLSLSARGASHHRCCIFGSARGLENSIRDNQIVQFIRYMLCVFVLNT